MRASACVAMFASALAGGACRRSVPAPDGPVGPRTDAGGDGAARAAAPSRAAAVVEAETSEEDAAVAAARLDGLICKRPRCCVTRVMPAGVGADGTRYTVVRLDLMPNRRRCAPPQTGEQEDVVDPAAIEAEKAGELDEKQRERYRWDLVEERGGKVIWRQPLAIDYWGVSDFGAGGGEDGLSADPATRTISYSNEGGSAWRGDSSVTVGLDPLRVVAFSRRSWWRGGQDEDSIEWSWDTFSGRTSASTAFCRTGPAPDAGFPSEAADAETDDRDEPVAARDQVIVPKIALPAGFVKTGWTTTSFRGCAAHVDGKDRGFTIHGPANGDKGDSEMWVAMSSSGVLFVEVIDDHLVPTAKSWVKADHLELWSVAGKEGSGRGGGCFQANAEAKAVQWGVGLDGRVHKAYGEPVSQPTALVTVTDHGARFRIVMPDPGGSVTVVYSDSDDGEHQKRLIATSRLRFGRPWTIGGAMPIAARRAACVETGGALHPRVVPLRRSPDLLLRDLPLDLDGD